MKFEELHQIINDHFYVIYKEKLENPDGSLVVEKMVAKHSLLKPKFIVINDQAQGFKKISKKVASLEKFPIFIEIEWFKDESGGLFLENIDIYAEADLSCQKRLSDIIYIANVYSKTVSLERVIQVSDGNNENIAIFSRLPEYLTEELIKSELEDFVEAEGFSIEADVKDGKKVFEYYLKSFINFIKLIDDILIKDKPLGTLKSLIEHSEEDDRDA
jgi:hypothetical protein